MRRILLSLFLVWAVQGLQAAPTNYVATSGSDITGDGSYNNPWLTIGKALQNAGVAGVNIYVGAGTYTENLTFGPGTNNVVLKGGFNTNGWAWAWDPANYPTIINSGGTNVLTIQAGANGNTIGYFTLTGGAGTGYGIYVRFSAKDETTPRDTLTLEGCSIISNKRGIYISGAANEGGDLTVKNCLIAKNGLGVYDDTGDTEHCQHYYYNCTVADDGTGIVYGVDNYKPTLTVKNCIVSGHPGYGIYHYSLGTDGSVENCLFYSNTVGHHTNDMSDLGNCKYNEDPLFKNSAAGNYHLKNGSPAISAGKTLTSSGVTNDLDGVARPYTAGGEPAGFEIGAYEYVRVPQPGTVSLIR